MKYTVNELANSKGVTPLVREALLQMEAKLNREWVGLTRAEFNAATNGLEDLEDCWISIEAKLKEKNV